MEISEDKKKIRGIEKYLIQWKGFTALLYIITGPF